MLFGGVEVPEEILEARDRGELLVFAGAGVSMGGRSNYPDFQGLIQDIGHNSGCTWDRRSSFDHYLGSLDNRGVRVHDVAQSLLTDPNSRPNPIHTALIQLFGEADNIRIVTTNFDTHFTAEAATVFDQQTDRFHAPALPVGSNFTGIVYVHGSVVDKAERLVLTDRDFGKAYSTEGWARRFLVEAFWKYTVLFIGYSHNDPPMVYLTRGLTPEAESLYALTGESEVGHWQHLGIKPIVFEKRQIGDRYGAVTDCIEEWCAFANMSMLDHRSQVTRLLSASPDQLTEASDSYLRQVFRSKKHLPFFYAQGMHIHWLLWAEEAGLLTPVFDVPAKEELAYPQQLTHWFTKHAVAHSQEALAVYMRAGASMPSHLWYAIGQAFHADKSADQVGRAVWSAQMILHWHPSYSSDYLEYAMTASAEQGDVETAIMILDFLSTPRIIHAAPFVLSSNEAASTNPKIKLPLSHGTGWCEDLWSKHLRAELQDHAIRLVEMATAKLSMAYELLLVHRAANESYDAVSSSRAAVEPSSQDGYKSEFHVLIDIARDSYEFLLRTNRSYARALHIRWSSSRSPVLRRLATHGMRIDTRISGNTKLAWIEEQDIRAITGLHHEVFELAKAAFPTADNSAQIRFLKYVRKTTERSIRRRRDVEPRAFWHHEYTLLATLVHSCSMPCRALKQRVAYLENRYPDMRVTDHPEYLSWTGGVKLGSESPHTLKDLQRMGVKELARLLINYRTQGVMGPNREGLLYVVNQGASQDPLWALQLADEFNRRKRYPDDIWPAIFNGLREAELDVDTCAELFSLFVDIPAQKLPLSESAICLEKHARSELVRSNRTLLGQALQRILALLPQVRRNNVSSNSMLDTHSWAINHPAGSLCDPLIWGLLARSKIVGDRWHGIPGNYKRVLRTMIRGRSDADRAARIVLAAHLHILYFLDPEWTVDELIPVFDWERDAVTANGAWQGYLRQGEWRKRYLQKMLPYYVQAVSKMRLESDEFGGKLAEHVAAICMFSGSRRARSTLLVRYFQNASDEQKVNFANMVTTGLEYADRDARPRIWKDWLRPYWLDRILGKPAPLQQEEIVAMLRWLPLLGDNFADGVDLLERSPAFVKPNLMCLYQFTETGLTTQFPDDVARFLMCLVSDATYEFFYAREFMKVATELAHNEAARSTMQKIVNQLAINGCVVEALEINAILDNG